MKKEKTRVISGNGFSYELFMSKVDSEKISNQIDNKVNELMEDVYNNLMGKEELPVMRAILTKQAWKQTSEQFSEVIKSI